jgi:iron complex transport system permease protein
MIIGKKRDLFLFILLSSVLVLAIFLHLISGQIAISFSEFSAAIFHFDPNNTKHIVALEFRLPRVTMALLAGAGLSISGMLMQTLFNNPLAGPYVLGINSGSSLFVAFSMMTGFAFFQTDFGIITSALIGALIFGFVILGFSLFVKSHISLLLIGLMLGSFTNSIISILQTFSSAQELKAFTMWTMGSLQHVQLQQLPIILLLFMLSVFLCLFLIKPLNVLVLGEHTTAALGMNVKRIRIATISITALFTGLITAFCGPIAFVGLAVPNVTRYLFRTQSHNKLLVANFFLGAIFLLLSDTIIQLLEHKIQLPINAFTSIIGAPIIILIVLKRLK